ncbi:MAG TPA: ubiquitin-like domain-containing protein [Kribbella sp.]|uniref:ubiquitin-like domain-containing protein n=1 Tax=Kribbella sp. TaxID=1871183 RepID=UPI002D78219C|nr:ubiquitin-like domain-containing protein [Kribbella sp.]HET6293596.1 ubiquitin-like domain-containing protein [Kribbella sp.]
MRKSIIAAVGATAVFAVVGGSVAYASKSKTVSVSVDGQVQKVHTFGSTVADALKAEKIQIGDRDVVAPALDAKLQDGQEIAVQYGRQLTVNADGSKRSFWTTADSVNEALSDLGLRYDGAYLSTSRSAPIGREGLELEVRTPKTVQFVRQGKVVSVKSLAMTVGEALTGAKVTHDGDDRITPAVATALKPGVNRITVVKVDVKKVTKTEAIAFAKKETKSAALLVGDTKTTAKGAAGKKTVDYVLTYLDGKLVTTKMAATKVLSQPVVEQVTVGTKPKPVEETTEADPPTGATGAWDRIAECESGGNWQANTGNGYYGGLQFGHSTWVAYGGDAYANNAHQASKAQQIAIAEKVRAARGGYGDWPVCGKKA